MAERGRPTKYTSERAAAICQLITEGVSLRKICKRFKLAVSDIFVWREKYPEFSEQYARAREMQAEVFADEIAEIADEPNYGERMRKRGRYRKDWEILTGDNVERSKLRVDTRKWIAARLLPKRYGVLAEKGQGVAGKDHIADVFAAFVEGPVKKQSVSEKQPQNSDKKAQK